MESNSLKEKMGDMEDSEGNVQGISYHPNVRRHHRRGKRKPRVRRRTLSTELTPADDSAQNSSKEVDIKKPDQAKEIPINIIIEQERSPKAVGMKQLSLKSNEAGHYKQFKEYTKKHRQNRQHRHPRHRNYKKIHTHMSKVLPSGEKMNSKMLILRPNRCPDAPKNSTQFIIDDHEDEQKDGASLPQETQNSKPSNGFRVTDETSSNDDYQPSPDDDTFWAEYLEKDFQTVYESAHREDVEKWDKPKLIEEIRNLERRHKDLVTKLSRVDPEIYIRRLQSRVISKQKHNSRLRARVIGDMKVVYEREQSSGVKETSKPNNEASQKENEIPSQSDAFQEDKSTDSKSPKNIVSFVPDSTNE